MLHQSCECCVYKLQSSSIDYCIYLDSFDLHYCLFFKCLSMYIPLEMQKVNNFEHVALPSVKSLFQRVGNMDPGKLQYSGDEPVPEQLSKSDSYDDFLAYAAQMEKEEASKESEK